MNYIREDQGAIIFENDGETLRIEPWGTNSLRVRAVMMGDIKDTDYALLPAPFTSVTIIIKDEFNGSITNGSITAVLSVDDWHKRCRVSFFNQKGELLLEEEKAGGALNKKTKILNQDWEVTMIDSHICLHPVGTAVRNGQYQQEVLNVKNCILELAHRNSQASVPLYFLIKDMAFSGTTLQ